MALIRGSTHRLDLSCAVSFAREQADMLWVKMPQWTRIAVCYHAFGFGTCYLLFAIIFLFGTKWLPSFIMCICSAKLYAGAVCIPSHRTTPYDL